MSRSIAIPILFLSIVVSFIMHFNHFNKDLISMHVWRQAQTQSNIQSFYEEDMNILNPRRNDRGDGDGIFRMEFPLMQWMVAAVYPVFGADVRVSRLFMFLIAAFSILGMYKLVLNLLNQPIAAAFGAWAFTFSPTFYYHSINPLPDNLALCFGIWGLAFFYKWLKTERWHHAFLCALMLSLGTLCKLPFVLFYAVPGMHFLFEIFKRRITAKNTLMYFQMFVLIVLPAVWYIAVIPQWAGNGITGGIADNNLPFSEILDNLQHHLISSLPETLLNYGAVLFFISAIVLIFKKRLYKSPKFFPLASLGVLLIMYLFFEANMIGKSHDYYLFPFYPSLFILVAYGAYRWYTFKSWSRSVLWVLLALIPVLCYLRMQDRWNPDSPGFEKALLVHKAELRNAVPKNSLVVAGNDASHFIFMYYIDKKGWGFASDNLTGDQLKDMIERGAEYLYSSSEAVNDNPEILQFIEEEIDQLGTISIFRLRQD